MTNHMVFLEWKAWKSCGNRTNNLNMQITYYFPRNKCPGVICYLFKYFFLLLFKILFIIYMHIHICWIGVFTHRKNNLFIRHYNDYWADHSSINITQSLNLKDRKWASNITQWTACLTLARPCVWTPVLPPTKVKIQWDKKILRNA